MNNVSIWRATPFFLALAAMQCKDMGNAPSKPGLTASTFAVTLNPGGQANVRISGGNPPYRISQNPDPALATAVLRNDTLVIQATGGSVSGTTSVKIKDSGSSEYDNPASDEQEIELTIRVAASTAISFSTQVQPTLTNRCVNEGCHPGGGGPFSLAAGQSYANLVNVQATASCASEKRVLPGNAASSVLYKRVAGTTCGTQMPQGRSALSSAEVNLIRDWINQGAANN